jgi:O-antigen ligase
VSAKLDKIIAAGLMVAMVFTALAHGAVEAWSVAIFELMVAALLFLWGIKLFWDERGSLRFPATALPIMALLGLALAQSVSINGRMSLSMDAEATRWASLTFLCLIGAFLIAANFLATRERINFLAWFFLTYGLALAIFSLIQHLTWNGKFYWVRPNLSEVRPFGPFVNHSNFAGYMELLIPFPVALILTGAVRAEAKLLCTFSAIVMGSAIVASLSRGGMISLGAGMAFLAIAGTKKKLSRANRKVPALLVVLAVVLAIGASSLWIGADSVVNRIAKTANEPDSRIWVWRDTLSMIRANPILGVGFGAYETAFSIYTKSNGSLRVPQAHNDYLQVVADCGMLGGAIAIWFLILLWRAFRASLMSSDPMPASAALASGAGIFSILVHSLFDFNLQIPSTALLFLVLTSVISNVGASQRPQREVRKC